MVLSAGYVSNAEADSESLNDQEINEIVSGLSSADLQKLVQTAEKKGKLSTAKSKKTGKKKKKKKKKNAQNYQSSELIQNGVPNANVDNINADQPAKKKKKKNRKKQKNIQQNSENNMFANNTASVGGVNNINQNQPIKKKKKKRKNKQKNVLQNPENNVLVNNNTSIGGVNNINQNQPIIKKKKKKKKKKNRQNNTSQNAAIVINSNQNRSISKNTNNRSDVFANKGRFDRSYQLKKKENTTDESWKYEVISASDLTNRGELTTINEPVIDGSKIKKSSIVIEKNIKLASNSEKTKAENKVNSPKLQSSNKTVILASNAKADKLEKKITPLKPLDKEKILAHLDSKKDINFVANLSNSETSIKDKLQQIKDNREAYNLIKTPNKDLKDNIQVKKFRAELDHYRKIYASNMEKA